MGDWTSLARAKGCVLAFLLIRVPPNRWFRRISSSGTIHFLGTALRVPEENRQYNIFIGSTLNMIKSRWFGVAPNRRMLKWPQWCKFFEPKGCQTYFWHRRCSNRARMVDSITLRISVVESAFLEDSTAISVLRLICLLFSPWLWAVRQSHGLNNPFSSLWWRSGAFPMAAWIWST